MLLITLTILAVGAGSALAHCGMCGIGEAKGSKGSMKENWAEEKVKNMTDELGLSEEQASQVSAIMKEKMDKKIAIYEEKKTKMEAVKEEYKGKLKKVLTDEQFEKYTAMKEKKKAEREEKGSGHEHKGSHHEDKGSYFDHKDRKGS